MNVAFGLGAFAFLAILLNLFHIPLDWRIFLVLSLILPIYHLIKHRKFPKPSLKLSKESLYTLLVLVIVLVSFYIYLQGAFSYPYLENEDPWGHSVGIKYVSIEKTAYDPQHSDFDRFLSYVDPYPPAYNILLGVLHQTSPDLTWTMKFFNALIISLSIFFFYFFAKLFVGNRNKALFATFVLASLPSYLSHFIWAHALIITLVFPLFYAFQKIPTDKKWVYLSAIMVAAVWFTQNLSQPLKISTLILIYLIVYSITQKKIFKKGFTAFFAGGFLSLLWWGDLVRRYSLKGLLTNYYQVGQTTTDAAVSSSTSSLFSKISGILARLTSSGGSASRAYSFEDFFFAQKENLINNPIGIGVIVSLLVLVGLVYVLWHYKSKLVKKENTWLAITLFWLIFTFWGVNGQTFPVSVARGPFRVWMLLAIPVSLLAAEGAYFLLNFFRKIKGAKLVIIVLLILGIYLTSTSQKFALNTTVWPTSSAFSNPQEAFEYGSLLESLPDNTKIFMLAPRPKLITGFGKFDCIWCKEIYDFRQEIVGKSPEEIYSFLKENNYEYLLINPSMDLRQLRKHFAEEEVQAYLNELYPALASSQDFEITQHIEQRIFLLKVK